jgi:hypothetical protein
LEPTDLALVTADVASMFRAAIERAGMRLQVDPATLSRLIQVDPEMWVRIVANGTTFTVQVPMSTASRETAAGGHPQRPGAGIPGRGGCRAPAADEQPVAGREPARRRSGRCCWSRTTRTCGRT